MQGSLQQMASSAAAAAPHPCCALGASFCCSAASNAASATTTSTRKIQQTQDAATGAPLLRHSWGPLPAPAGNKQQQQRSLSMQKKRRLCMQQRGSALRRSKNSQLRRSFKETFSLSANERLYQQVVSDSFDGDHLDFKPHKRCNALRQQPYKRRHSVET